MVNTIWTDRKRIIFGLPWSFTKYGLSEDRLFLKQGFLNVKEDEVRLYRIMDVGFEQSLFQRMFNIGTVTCHSSDKTHNTLIIKNVKNADKVKELISSYVEEERSRKNVTTREFIVDGN